MLKISSILIGVTDLKRSKIFYENVFGMNFSEFRPPFSSAYIGDLEFNIEENTKDRDPDRAKNYIGVRNSLSFEVDNIEECLKKVILYGGKIMSQVKTMPRDYKEAIITDQDANSFIIEQKIG